MAKTVIYCRVMVPKVEDESHQVFGDFLFSPNGAVRLGPTMFARGMPIHRHRFGADLVALRSVNEPNTLIVETPVGTTRFLYRPLFRTWYQLVEVDDPKLYLHQGRFGTHVAILLYYIRWGTRWVFVETLQIVLLFLAFAVLAFIANYFD